ncbi:MAG: hypothetical protein NZ925_01400, partial [Sulfolobales archaeon]|nr:hypothetical protein [Sulfolobales archaeon]
VTYRHSGSANFKRHISLAIKKAACSTATSRLKKLMSHHLTKKLAQPARELLYGELNSLFNTIEEVKNLGKDVPDDGILYSQLLDVRAGREPSSSVDGCKCRDDREKRNFIAHAGLLKDCVKIKKCGDDYCLEIPSELLECLK